MAFLESVILPSIMVGVIIASSSVVAFPEEAGYDLSPQEASGYSYGTPKSKGLPDAAVPSDAPASGKVTSIRGINSSKAVRVPGSLQVNIPRGGVPGRDYPILSSVPNTGFSCGSQLFPGYFADTSRLAGCQVFHICQFDGRQDSFLCPNGTIFNQQYFVCDWWFNVDCSATPLYISLNTEIGKIPVKSAAAATATASGGASVGAIASRPNSRGPLTNSAITTISTQVTSTEGAGASASPSLGTKKPLEGYKIPNVVTPSELYETATVTKPSGLYGTPNEK